MNKNLIVYSVFSGCIFEMPEIDSKILDVTQIPLKQYPKKNCNKCYGRYYTSRDTSNFAYYACNCVRKVVDRANYTEKL